MEKYYEETIRDFIDFKPLECIMITEKEFEKNKSKYQLPNHIIVISDTNESFIWVNDKFENIESPEEKKNDKKITRTKCKYCDGSLDLNYIPYDGNIKCDFCGNWNIVYEG